MLAWLVIGMYWTFFLPHSSTATFFFGFVNCTASNTRVQAFACNNATPQSAYTLNAASTDLSTVVALCNQIRTALINNGVCA